MLGLAEYVSASAELLQIAKNTETKTAKRLVDVKNKQTAIAITRKLSNEYQEEYEQLLARTLADVSDNAVGYYGKKLNVPESKYSGVAKRITALQYEDEYFGLTLARRLLINKRRLQRNITASAQIGIDKLQDVYTKAYPFGAQVNTDRRLMLSYAVRIENEVAKEMAKRADIPLIRWTLARRHRQTDICDDLANNVDKAVVAYLQEHKIKENPKGLYFADQLPQPPHPNCQCEFGMVSRDKSLRPGPVKRAAQKIKQLIKRLRGK